MAGFRKATKQAKKLVLSFQGGSGSGKTYSALNIAKHLIEPGQRLAFIDTERSADLYSGQFDFDVDDDFGTFGKLNYHPNEWVKKLVAAAGEKLPDGRQLYGAVILDSLTHAWKGPGGLLSEIDRIGREYKARTGKFADSHSAWKEIDPVYAKFMNDLRHLPFHVLFCVRAKQHYDRVQEGGKTKVTKAGIEPEFRNDFEYDVDAQFSIDEDHVAVPRKHRLGAFLDGKFFDKPGEDLAGVLKTWLASGAAPIVDAKAVDAPKQAPPGTNGARRPNGPETSPGLPPPQRSTRAGKAENVPEKLTTGAPPVEISKDDPQHSYTLSNEAAQAQVDKAVATCVPDAPTVTEQLAAEMGAAQSAEDLALVAKKASVAKGEGHVTPDEYKTLTKAYRAKSEELKAAAAAAAPPPEPTEAIAPAATEAAEAPPAAEGAPA